MSKGKGGLIVVKDLLCLLLALLLQLHKPRQLIARLTAAIGTWVQSGKYTSITLPRVFFLPATSFR